MRARAAYALVAAFIVGCAAPSGPATQTHSAAIHVYPVSSAGYRALGMTPGEIAFAKLTVRKLGAQGIPLQRIRMARWCGVLIFDSPPPGKPIDEARMRQRLADIPCPHLR